MSKHSRLFLSVCVSISKVLNLDNVNANPFTVKSRNNVAATHTKNEKEKLMNSKTDIASMELTFHNFGFSRLFFEFYAN